MWRAGRNATLVVASLLSATAHGADVCANGLDVAYGACRDTPDPTSSCLTRLLAKPDDFYARLGLCEAYVEAGKHDDAIAILSAGMPVHDDRHTRNLINLAMSNVEENRSQPRRQAGVGTIVSHHVMRCTRLKKAEDCDDAIQLDPMAVDAWRGLAEIRDSEDHLVDAIRAYRKVVELDSDEASVERLATLEAARQASEDSCMSQTGSDGWTACERARYPGDPDEGPILLRAGDLAWSIGRLDDAERSYREASYLLTDVSVNARLAAITPSRGCLQQSAADACRSALEGVPAGELSNTIAYRLSFRGCELSAPDRADLARDLCAVAQRTSRPGPQREAVAALTRNIAPAQDPAEQQRTQCLEASRNGLTGDALTICRTALASAQSSPWRSELATLVEKLEDDRLEADCLERGMSEPDICRRALAVVAEDRRGPIQQILQQFASTKALAECRQAAREQPAGFARSRCQELAGSVEIDADSRAQIQALANRLANQLQTTECLGDAADIAAQVEACRLALATAAADSTAVLEQRIESLEALQRNNTATALRQQQHDKCIGAWDDPDEGLTFCQQIESSFGDDPAIAVAMARLEKQARPYSNAPILEITGVGAVTY